MKTNKEVIDALQDYFLKQDPKDIARVLAATLIDINRIRNYESLEYEEQQCLQFRLDHNLEELRKFIKKGPDGTFTFSNVMGRE